MSKVIKRAFWLYMRRSEVNNESGSVLVETALVAPVLLLLIFFGVDMFFYSQSKTFVSQVARESAFYLATVPGTLVDTNPFINELGKNESADWKLACDANYNDDDCPHLQTQIRVNRMLSSAKVLIDAGNASITTDYDTDADGNFVSVSIDVPVLTFFGMFSGNVQRTVKLRRVNT